MIVRGPRRLQRGKYALAFRALVWLPVVLAAVSACSPAYRLDLTNTSWVMRTIDGVEIPAAEQATITFFADEVRVTMNCGSVTNVLWLDTDGSGLHFMASDTVRDACGGATSPVEHDQLEVLHGVESWRIIDDNRIVLEGEREVVLDGVP